MGYRRIYIQSVFHIPDTAKLAQEILSLQKIGDNFQKIVILGGRSPRYQNEDGILFVDIYDFLLKRGIS